MALDCPHCNKPIEGAFPKQRFDEVNEERKAFKTKVDEYEKNGKSAEVIAAKLEEAERALVDANNKHSIDLSMIEVGIKDQEIRDAFEWQYGKLPAEGRKPFNEMIKAWADKPEEAPAVVRSLLPKPATAVAVAATVAAPVNAAVVTRPGFVRHRQGAEGGPTSGQVFRPGEIRERARAGTLDQSTIDNAWAVATGQPLPTDTKAS